MVEVVLSNKKLEKIVSILSASHLVTKENKKELKVKLFIWYHYFDGFENTDN